MVIKWVLLQLVIMEKESDNKIETEIIEKQSEATSPYASTDVKKAASRWVTVEPIAFLIAFAIGIFLTIQPQILRQILADARGIIFPGGGNFCGPRNTSHPYYIILTEIQADVAWWQMVITLCGNLPSLFMAPILGACSDKVGRRLVLGLAALGYVVTSITYLIVFYFDTPLWVFPIGFFIQGLTGGHGMIIAGCAAYITDVTTKETRMFRMAILHGIFLIGIAVPQLCIGFLIEKAGFGPALWLTLVSLIICLLYIFIPRCFLETIDKNRWRQEAKKSKKSRFHSLLDVFRYNTGYRRLRLALIFIVEFLDEMLNANTVSLVIIYGLGPPFCWSPVTISGFLALVLFSSAIAMVVGTKGFSLCMSDLWVLQISMVFAVINGLFIAFVNQTSLLFVASAIGSLRALTQPVIETILSKMVSPEEHGLIFAFESSVLNLGTLLSPVFLNNIYSATVQTQPNLVFIMVGVCGLVPLILTGVLQFVTKRAEDINSNRRDGDNNNAFDNADC
ncbi:proton-coupled folate transporter-like [Amphiura filiformis]|uniref:proton-coupled folate transporter-like n=1 Tax=Amphiura filiformis TaxID=82378 RepID=UPI003B21D5D7